ncbi:PLDc N-terminal domain-containing protein [Actinocorallia sp. API 0066]|uniref:SHOCT domain-containing protein n=1 Tax=Actinocorallia sp. API 0066 TaxID=2896846 RepID=UPI001E4F6BF8|nr:SHOCT domain-containing protein [Actinocorallia sp. API 0066]MCD0448906.1 PLDc N-terminal domain-containing protein [Actinocorallia sp. API 0066]
MDDYPLLNLFWTMLVFFCWVIWLFLLFRVFADLFSDHELSGWAKAAWTVGLILLPFVGVLAYLIVRGRGMTRRDAVRAERQQEEFRSYVRKEAQAPSAAEELGKLAALRESNAISDEEYARAKAKILS